MAMIIMERDTIRHLTDPADVTRWEGYGYHVVADPAPAPSEVEAPEETQEAAEEAPAKAEAEPEEAPAVAPAPKRKAAKKGGAEA